MLKESFEAPSFNDSESEKIESPETLKANSTESGNFGRPESEKLILEEVLKKVGQVKNLLNFYSEKKMIGTSYNISAEKLDAMNRLLTDCDQTLLRIVYPKIGTTKK